MIILGKRFSVYAKATSSLLVEEFFSLKTKSNSYILGQGLSLKEYQQVLSVCEEQNIELFDAVNYSNCASLAATHKHNQENILITKPQKLKENIFACELIVFQNNELIIDHQTGLHIQGMLLIEAIRQMFIAVVEEYFPQENKSYVVFNDLKVEFQHFVFPFKVEIKQKIIKIKTKKKGAVFYESKFEVFQLGKPVLLAYANYSVYDKKYMEKKEMEIAEEAITQLKEKF